MNRKRHWASAGKHLAVSVLLGISAALIASTLALRAEPIPEDFKKGLVGFIYAMDTNGASAGPIGTCFFVGKTGSKEFKDRYFVYLVTARHVLEDSRGNLPNQVSVRLSSRDGTLRHVVVPLAVTNQVTSVFFHPDRNVDVVVVPIAANIVQASQMKLLPYDLIASKDHIKKFNVREGDEMYFVGLFTPFYGSKSNIPIARFGRLAMMADEPIPLGNGSAQDFYLMETPVFGGNSGSPAMFHFSKERNPNDTAHLLAGIVKGYFVNYASIETIDVKAAQVAKENSGIALVTPAYKLLEILNRPELKKLRGED